MNRKSYTICNVVMLALLIASQTLASTTVGDKIGFTSASPGADTNTWGTVLNSMFTGWDEFFYAGREDRNMQVSGGGKISYDNATGQVTFTASIVFRNHITAFVNNVTTAASPVTLSAANKVGYVQITRKPGSDQNITSVTTVVAGSLPNTATDADAGTFVLFQRTSDGTLWIPAAQKEVMSGDHWQVGTAQTWYERTASRAKPGFKSVPADTSQLISPASATSPGVVYIDGKLYANVADETLDLDTAGRNGLDTGTKAASTVYYLYAIPSASGRTWDVVCSVTAPSGAGPTGFSSWSYMGAFVTRAASAIGQFVSSGGFYKSDINMFSTSTTTSTTFVSRTLTPYPSTVKTHYGEIIITTGTSIGAVGSAAGQGTISLGALECALQVTGSSSVGFGYVPALDGVNIWIKTSNAANTVRYDPYGWVEDPMEFK